MKVCCDTEGRELTDERRYAPTSVPLRRKPCSRSPETLFHFTGIPAWPHRGRKGAPESRATEHCPIDDEHAHAKAPQATPAAPRAMRDTTVFAVDGKPPEQNRPRAKAQGPRRARGGHRHGRALRAFMITRGASTPRPGRTNRSRRAYQPLAPGVPTARAGRTNRSRRAYQAGSTIGPRGSTLHEHCPIDDEAERPRQARRWRRPGRAPARLRVGGGRKHASPWAYRPRAVGVLTKRRGHTYTAPWAQSRCAPGVLTLRAGRTHPARRAYSPCLTLKQRRGARGRRTPCAPGTHPARRAYSLRALDVLAALEKVHAACPQRANTAPSRPARSAR